MARPAGAALIAICCIMVFCALSFAGSQAIWVDETTQLSGLTLGVGEQLAWLTGRMEHPFAVPPDRMPPVSYWLGSLWSGIFGLSEMSLRVFGIACAFAAMPALFLAGRLAGGVTGGLFAVAFLFTSPGFIIQTVEIRAYPLFFCFSAWAAYLHTRLVTRKEPEKDTGEIAGLMVVLILLSYTHFYGVVASGFFFLTLFVHRWQSARPMRALLVCGFAGTVMLAGVVPFVISSVSMTSAGPLQTGGLVPALSDAARLVFNLVASGVLMTRPVLLLTVLAGVAILSLCLATAQLHPQGRQSTTGFVFVALPVVAALIALTAIRTKTDSFAVLAAHYNLWLLPLIAIAFAFAFALRGAWTRRIVTLAAVCLVSAQLLGLTTLMNSKSLYSHGPGEAIAAVVKNPETTLIILDATDPWGVVYFPMAYLWEERVTHWLNYPDGSYRLVVVGGLEKVADPQSALQGFETVLRVQTAKLNNRQLAGIFHNPESCQLPPSRLLDGVPADQAVTFCAYTAARYSVSEK